MPIAGNGSTSIRKAELGSQKTPLIGFKKIVFAHKANAGETSISLAALTLPTEMSGFVNPSATELNEANLLFYRKNLTLVSSLRGVLVDFLSYNVTANMLISFTDSFGTTMDDEIFIGVIDHGASTGIQVVDAQVIGATGDLLANTTDFNVGQSFAVNKYPTRQFGEVMVFLDGAIQYRNTGNSSTSLDGNYYEVDAGDGTGIIIRFNETDVVDRDVMVVGTGLTAESPNGSQMAVINTLAGKIDTMADYVAALAGTTPSIVTGGAVSYVDLKAFGDRVIAIEANYAKRNVSNTWTAYQMIPGRSDGNVIPTGFVGERKVNSSNGILVNNTGGNGSYANDVSLVLEPGIWDLTAVVTAGLGTTPAANYLYTDWFIGTVPGNNSTGRLPAENFWEGGVPTANFNLTGTLTDYRVIVTTTTTYYLKIRQGFTAGTPTFGYRFSAVRR